ncbi:MAG: SDR family oxidoreductase [Candidatus Aenigmarchaeota archaeon]|nr:SDR family oxidoreductase [Candidatus Aenigmarchaeota archaeon]
MRIIVVGASGLIGNIAFKEFSMDPAYDVFGTYFSQNTEGLLHLDMMDKKEVGEVMSEINPDIIFHPAANANAEYCESHPVETRKTNVDGSRNLIEAAKETGAKLVFFSSDYVFDGLDGPYSEEDAPNPINEYGRQKLEIENLIRNALSNYLIIRTTVVYGWELKGKNFVIQVIRNLSNNLKMNVANDQFGSPTYANNMVQIVKELVGLNKTGLYNVVGRDVMDRYSFAKKVTGVFGLNADLIAPTTTDKLGQKAKRPMKAGMKTTKVQNVVTTHILCVDDGLKEMKKEQMGGIS